MSSQTIWNQRTVTQRVAYPRSNPQRKPALQRLKTLLLSPLRIPVVGPIPRLLATALSQQVSLFKLSIELGVRVGVLMAMIRLLAAFVLSLDNKHPGRLPKRVVIAAQAVVVAVDAQVWRTSLVAAALPAAGLKH